MAGAQTAWGVDVGVTSLKAIKLKRDGDQVSVEAFDVIEHDRFLSDPDADRNALIQSALQKLASRQQLKKDPIYISVPGSMAFARFVKLPPVEPKKIPEIVRFEAIQQIPFPLDQVNWDFHTFQAPDSPDVEVGIFAMKKELVAQVMANFRAVEMKVAGVQISPLADYNAAAYDGMTEDKGTVIIDMGADHTDLIVMDQGRIWLRTINMGGNSFTEALAKSFKQSNAKAEILKKQAATSKHQKQLFQAMRPIFADFVAEIQRSIGHYNSSHRDSRLERIVAMGNPFKLPNLQKYLQQELKMEVVRLDNFRRMRVDSKLAASFNETVLSMGGAYGLAVQGLGQAPIKTNLLPVEIAREMMWRSKTKWFVAATALIVAAVALTGVQYWMTGSSFAATENSSTAASNSHDIAEAVQLKQAYSQVPNTFTTDKAQIDQLMSLAQYRAIWPMLTLDILKSLPQAEAAATTAPATQASTQTAATQAVPGAAPAVVINSIFSEYRNHLIEVSTIGGPGGTFQAAQPTAPSGDDNPDGGAPPPPPAAASASGVTAPGMVGPSDHGFVITINGYNAPAAGVKAFEIPRYYLLSIMKKAPLEDTTKPYYFSDPGFSGQLVPAPLPGTTTNNIAGPWVRTKGPFFEVFGAELAGIKIGAPANPDMPASGPNLANGDLGGPIDLFNHSTETGPKYMYNNFQFTLMFKVHVR